MAGYFLSVTEIWWHTTAECKERMYALKLGRVAQTRKCVTCLEGVAFRLLRPPTLPADRFELTEHLDTYTSYMYY